MAVYKATFCSPLLSSVDPRVAPRTLHKALCEWIKCKVDTSNKNITGYSIRILTQRNEQIFPVINASHNISPISELAGIWDTEVSFGGENINTGVNGTMLHLPFFQNYNYSVTPAYNNMVLPTYNAIYYTPHIKVEYVDPLDSQEWSNVPGSSNIQNIDWDGTFNGEPVAAGDLVLCSTNDIYEGIWEVQKDGTLKLTDMTFSAIENKYILATHGSVHNKIYKFVGHNWVPDSSIALWQDIAGNSIDLSVDGETYKWEITLYQGDVTPQSESVSVPGFSGEVKYVSYEELDYEWFDMILNSGTILGSTEKRIQIADSDSGSAILPYGSLTNPLVLQGTYVQLFNSNNEQISRRAYVKTYDASYGHVYPESNAFQLDWVNAAANVQFFKHSNDPDAVLAGEKVAVATVGDIDLSSAPTASTTIDGYTVKFGDWVLIKDQDDPKENGIYVSDSAGWSRSGSYKSWGDFIGAIIFVENGTVNGGKNWESLASVNGSLYVEGDQTSGDSPLYFKEESPIILFPDKIDYSVDLIQKSDWQSINPTDISGVVDSNEVDGIQLTEGKTIAVLFSNETWGMRQIISCIEDNTQYRVTWDIIESNISNKIIYANEGKEFGKSCIKTNSLSSPYYMIDESSSTAKILKNTTTKTYISPYLNLKKDMALKLSNGKSIVYHDYPTVYTPWIRVSGINNTLWYITHDELTEPLLSSKPNDNSVPYVYTIRSYFKSSDENVFYTYETPYLRLKQADGASSVGLYEQYQVYNDMTHEEEAFLDSNSLLFYVKNMGLSSIGERYVTLYGDYKQFQQLSWESYRWKLLNSRGYVIQDTGDKFDKEMKVTFYGLSNDVTDYQNIYYAVLYVTDSIGNTLSGAIELIISSSSSDIDVGFSAQYECDSHSVILSYQDNAYFTASVEKDGYAYRATPTNLVNQEWGFWDESYYYTTEDSQEVLWITGEDSSMEATIPNIYAKETDLINEQSGLSGAVIYGLEYCHYFPLNDDRIDANSNFLVIQNNEFSFETEIKLDENYCGQILKFNVEGAVQNEYLQISLSTAENFISGHKLDNLNANRHNLNITFDAGVHSSTNALKVYSDGSAHNVSLFEIPSSGHQYFVIQCADDNGYSNTDTNGEYHAFTYGASGEYSLWYHQGVADNHRIYLNSHKPYGNCCLISDEEIPSGSTAGSIGQGAPIYWAENRGTVYYLTNNNTIQHTDNKNINLLVEDNTPGSLDEKIPDWPEDGATEREFTWLESATDSGLSVYPNQWSSVNAPVGAIKKWTARKRHPNLNTNWMYLRIAVTDANTLYTGVNAEQLTLGNPTESEPNKMAILIDGTEVGYIIFKFKENN